MNVGELMVSLALNITDFDRKLDEAEAKGLTFTETLQSVFASADPKVDIQVKDGVAEVKIEDFKAMLDSIPDEKTTHLNVDNGGMGRGGGAAEAAAANAGGGGGGWLVGAIAAAIPAIAPLAAAGTSAIMGLASAFTSAGAGAVGFGIVAISNLKTVFTASSNLTKAQQAYNNAVTDKQRQAAMQQEAQVLHGLNAAQLKAVHSLQTFGSFWNNYMKSFQSPVFQLLELALTGIQTVMTDMRPVITAAGSAFVTLFNQVDKALANSDTKQFFNWLAQTTGPAIIAFGHAAGNVFRGIANLMMAFTGPAKSMESGLVHLTSEFYKWTDSLAQTKGFEDFLKYAAVSGKAVLDLIGNLARLIGTLLKAMAPLGLVLVKTVSDLAKWINQLMTTNPLIKVLVELVIGAAKNILQFVDAVIKMFTWLGKTHPAIMDIVTAVGLATAAFFAFNAIMAVFDATTAANPVGLIVVAIALLVAAGVELVKHWGAVKSFFSGLWHWFTTETTKVWNGISAFLRKWGVDLLAIFVPVIGIPLLIQKHWSQISAIAKKIWGDVTSAIKDVFNVFTKWISNAAQAVVDGIIKAFQWMYNHNYYFKDLVDSITKVWSALQKDTEKVWNSIEKFFEHIWNAIKKTAKTVWNDVSKAVETVWKDMVGLAKTIWTPVKEFFSGIWSSISSTATRLWQAISGSVSSGAKKAYNGVTGIFDRMKSYFSNLWTEAEQWGANIVNHIAQGIESAVARVRTAVSHVASAIGNFLGFHSPTKEGPGSTADTWMPNLMNMLTEGIKSGVPNVQAALSGVFSVPALSGIGGVLNVNPSLGIGSSNGAIRPIIVYLDGREVARGTAPHLVDEIRLETGLRM